MSALGGIRIGTFDQSKGTDTGPFEVQYVSIQLPLMVPAGVTLQDWLALPAAIVAVTEN